MRLLGFLAAILIATAVGISAFQLIASGVRIARLARYRERLDRDLSFLLARVSATQVISCQAIGLAVIVTGSLALRMGILWVAVVPVVMGPRLSLLRACSVRRRAIEAQLDGWLTTLSNGLVASASLGEALGSSARLVESPLREEIERMMAHVQMGTPLDRAMTALGTRVGSPVVSGALLSLRIARNAGGELRPVLQDAAAALRDMARFEGVVRAKTAEGRAQALALSIIPAPLVISIHLLSPEFFAPLAGSLAGLLIVGAAGALWLEAIALAARIATVDV